MHSLLVLAATKSIHPIQSNPPFTPSKYNSKPFTTEKSLSGGTTVMSNLPYLEGDSLPLLPSLDAVDMFRKVACIPRQ